MSLRGAIHALGGDLAASLGPEERPEPAVDDEIGLILAMIREGSELHYGTPSLLEPEDPDLALLLGDQLYAAGLLRLAELGDLRAVVELADLISLEAQAAAEENWGLRADIWRAGAAAVRAGANAQHTAAKRAVREGDQDASRLLHEAFDGGRS